MTWLQDHAVGLAWTAAGWAFVIAVVGGALLRRWRRHESHDAAATKKALGPPPTTHPYVDHRWDAM